MPTIMEQFLAGEVQCLECHRRGTVSQTTESGGSRRVLTWLPATKSGKRVHEPWEWATPPSYCPKCWQRKLERLAAQQAAAH